MDRRINAAAATQAPAPRRLPRKFEILVRRDGKTTRSTEWADTWFDVWCDAIDQHGHDCRIDVSPLERAP